METGQVSVIDNDQFLDVTMELAAEVGWRKTITGGQEIRKLRVLSIGEIVQWILESLRIMAGGVRKEVWRHRLD